MLKNKYKKIKFLRINDNEMAKWMMNNLELYQIHFILRFFSSLFWPLTMSVIFIAI